VSEELEAEHTGVPAGKEGLTGGNDTSEKLSILGHHCCRGHHPTITCTGLMNQPMNEGVTDQSANT